jgi:hypothetical protein
MFSRDRALRLRSHDRDIETYKTRLFSSRPRGKSFGKPVAYPEILRRRGRFVPVYVAVWICAIAMLGLALSRPHLPFIV